MHNIIHRVEEWKMPIPSSKAVMYLGVAAIPVAVLLHDTCDLWMKSSTYYPIITFFSRRWKADPANKELDLTTFRNAIILAWIVAILNETEAKQEPVDYVLDRLVNSTTRRHLTNDINSSRRLAFANAFGFIHGNNDFERSTQLRDAALKRRQVQEENLALD